MELIQSLQGLSGLIETAELLEQNGLPFSSLSGDLEAIGAVSKTDLNRLAGPSIPLDQALLILVGDKRLVQNQLKSLNLPVPTELTVSGDPKAM
jgi:hypothetical protein